MTDPRSLVPLLALLALAACAAPKTDGPTVPEEKPPVPMTRQQASSECWMRHEKGHASLDARIPLVEKCIAEKMAAPNPPAAPAAAAPAPATTTPAAPKPEQKPAPAPKPQ